MLDQISNDRLDIGTRGGWMEAEYSSQFGMVLSSVRDRLRMLDATYLVIIAFWPRDRANFEGERYQLRDTLHDPKAIRQPHPRS